MGWDDILGHDSVRDRFEACHRNNRLANTYLFVGMPGIGKRRFALELAKALLCETNETSLEACGTCPACVQVTSEAHPDLILVSKPADKNFIPVESFLGDREHRRREGLCHDINLTPFSGKRKVAIIDDADFLNAESANSLLKTLEEPPKNSLLILIGSSEHRQLQTIVSRSQVVRFSSLSMVQILEILNGPEMPGEVDARKLAHACGGSVELALLLDNKELFEFRLELFGRLASLDPADNGFAKTVCDFVDAQSKEGAVKRRFQRCLGDFSIQFYDGLIQRMLNPNATEKMEPDVLEYCERMLGAQTMFPGALESLAANCIERTMVFQRQVDANLAMANSVPSWLNDLGKLSRNELVIALDQI